MILPPTPPIPTRPFFTLNDVFPAPVSIAKGTWPIPIGDQGGELFNRQSPQTIDSDSAVTPYIQRWSFDIQREIGKAVVASIGYVGSEGTKLPIQYDLNLPQQGVYLNSDEYYDARPLDLRRSGPLGLHLGGASQPQQQLQRPYAHS